MDWVHDFYSITDEWWGPVESAVDALDHLRAKFVVEHVPESVDVLELGCGYGATAAATAQTGRRVVGVDLSTRIDRGSALSPGSGSLELLRKNFYTDDLGSGFDAVCYWDGFGVGTDAEQSQLLRLIAHDWLAPKGVAIVEVYHPEACAADHGLDEVKEPDQVRGYAYRLGHRRSYDHNTNVASDTWWEIGSDTTWTQTLRCYTPDEFNVLAEGAGLRVASLGNLFTQSEWIPNPELPFAHSYIAVLVHSSAR